MFNHIFGFFGVDRFVKLDKTKALIVFFLTKVEIIDLPDFRKNRRNEFFVD